MARKREKLDHCGEASQVLSLLEEEPAGWRRERLVAVKLGLEGEQSLEQIAHNVGRARSAIQRWLEAYRRGGVALLLKKGRGKGPQSELPEAAAKALKKKLARGKMHRGRDIQQWLQKRWKVEVALSTVYKYLGKCGASLKVARPAHPKKNEASGHTFRHQ